MAISDIRSRLRQAFATNDEQESRQLLDQAIAAGATPINRVNPRDLVTVRGTLASITLTPVHGLHWLRAELSDGSGTMGLVWMGRRTVPGVNAGVTLEVTGRVTRDEDGMLVMYNPRYELIAD